MPYGYYNYGQQTPYYAPPMPDQLAQLRNNQYQQAMNQQGLNQQAMQMVNNQPATAQMQNSRIWVSNYNEVTDYLVAPNCSVDLWHINGNTMYTKQADASGKPTIKEYEVIERTTAPKTPLNGVQNSGVEYVTRDEFNALAAEIEALRAKKCNCRTKATEKNTSSDDEKE